MKSYDEKTKNELVRALADRDDFVGAVIVGVIANKTPREIALEQGGNLSTDLTAPSSDDALDSIVPAVSDVDHDAETCRT